MTIKQDIKDISQRQMEENTNKYRQMFLDWEAEIRERRNYDIPSKINYTRPMMAAAWKATHLFDSQSPLNYVPDDIWARYTALAVPYFENHPKRIYVDSYLWLPIFKEGNSMNLPGERAMTTLIMTIMSERELAKKDGEPQDPIPPLEEGKKVYKTITTPEVPGHAFVPVREVINKTATVTRERNENEDMGLPPLEIYPEDISF